MRDIVTALIHNLQDISDGDFDYFDAEEQKFIEELDGADNPSGKNVVILFHIWKRYAEV